MRFEARGSGTSATPDPRPRKARPELPSSLRVRLRETSPGVYRMGHDPDKHDDQALALALAAKHLITRPEKRQWRAY